MDRRKATVVAAVLSVALFASDEWGLAHGESAKRDCKHVSAQAVGVFDELTNTTAGTLTEAGRLNGTYAAVFGNVVLPTPDPASVTFTAEYTVTTTHGELKASNVYLLDVVSGAGAVLSRINPNTSTGRFAGATGVLHAAGKVISFSPFTVEEAITGEICYAD